VNVEIPEKLAAFAAALAMNALIITGVVICSASRQNHTPLGSLRQAHGGSADALPRGDDYCRCAATSQLPSNSRSQ
jgi:hypothetical protein